MASRTDPMRIVVAAGALWLVGAGIAWRDLRQPATADAAIPASYDLLPDVLRPLAENAGSTAELEGSTTSPVRLGARDPFDNGVGVPVAESQGLVGAVGTTIDPAPDEPREFPWTVGAIMPGRRRAAVINDALVYVGTALPGGWTLTAVEDAAVVLTDPRGVRHRIAVQPQGGPS